MHRRDFLRASAAVVGTSCAVTAGEQGLANSQSPPPSLATVSSDRTAIREAPRTTPVVADVDVVVVGGGPTGVGAALAAASGGVKTLLVERHGMLGGMWTAGLLNPMFDSQKGWLVDTLVRRLKDAGAWRSDDFAPVFDTEMMKYVLETMLKEAGVDFWYHVQATDPVLLIFAHYRDTRMSGFYPRLRPLVVRR